MRAYALVELGDSETIDLFLQEQDARRALSEILWDEPEWAGSSTSSRSSSTSGTLRRTSSASGRRLVGGEPWATPNALKLGSATRASSWVGTEVGTRRAAGARMPRATGFAEEISQARHSEEAHTGFEPGCKKRYCDGRGIEAIATRSYCSSHGCFADTSPKVIFIAALGTGARSRRQERACTFAQSSPDRRALQARRCAPMASRPDEVERRGGGEGHAG
jgi:hypothetical protein